MKPGPAKPSNIMAHVERSGTPVVGAPVAARSCSESVTTESTIGGMVVV